ncbi:MAG: DEAD/DEAH box helicase, partial [SAR324 cluster bacterium]|nr:DEAD/DEAH box helicase [SAR324 cluster bacterium]
MKTLLPFNQLPEGSTVYQFRRDSGNNSPLSKQDRVLKKVTKELKLKVINLDEGVIKGVSGSTLPLLTKLDDFPKGANIIMANVDRATKSMDSNLAKKLWKKLRKRKITIYIPTEEYTKLNLIIEKLPMKKTKNILVEFLSSRDTEGIIGTSKCRKGASELVDLLFPLLQKSLEVTSLSEVKRWILAGTLGAWMNELYKDFTAHHSTRLPRVSYRAAQFIYNMSHQHTEWKSKDIAIRLTKGHYDVQIKPRKVKDIKKSIMYKMIGWSYELGFESGLQVDFESLEPLDEPTTLEGLDWKETSRLQYKLSTKSRRFEGLRLFQAEALELLKMGEHVVVQVAAGGGKSLLFIIPAMRGKRVLVVSPYNRLITNQVKASGKLLGKNKVDFINGKVLREEKVKVASSLGD